MPARCPACESTGARLAPPSRTSDRVVAACPTCGCHWLANPPAAEEVLDNQDYDRDAYEMYVNAKRAEALDKAQRATLTRLRQLIRSGGNDLFDLGAGAGDFLTVARDHGFTPHGNELAPGAIEMAREHAGIELHLGDLSTLPGENLYDAVTLWCVLAHVTHQDELLREVLRILKPGGVLFVQTPRWSGMDSAALAASRATRGRVARVLDRRINGFHMTLNSVAGLSAQASRCGFEVVEVRPRARYSLQTQAYLQSMGMSARPSEFAARVLDEAVDRDLIFRNVLDLYARKPR